MKRIAVPVILAAGCFVLAGCGSGHKVGSNVTTLPRSIVYRSSDPNRLVVSGTATIPHVKPGTHIACKGEDDPGMTVPAVPPAVGDKSYSVQESDSGHWSNGRPTTGIALSAASDGTVTVTCGKK
jgi:predicted small secreted protein